MSKLLNMRGIEIKKFRAVSSGLKTFDELFGKDGFGEWLEAHRHLVQEHIYEPTDILYTMGGRKTC